MTYTVLFNTTILILISGFLIFTTDGQERVAGKDVDENVIENINVIFNPVIPTTSPVSNEGETSDSSKTDNCICVPNDLCKNGKITSDMKGIEIIRIKDGSCPNDLKICCYSNSQKSEPAKPNCGHRKKLPVGGRILGNLSEFGEFPWMVALVREIKFANVDTKLYTYQCGAALIHPQVVITAAHCVKGKKFDFIARAGDWDSRDTQEKLPFQDRKVVSIKIHPEYYAKLLYNDIALLYLESAFEIAENVDTVCLPLVSTKLASTTCCATGWGKNAFGPKAKYQTILNKVDLPIVPSDKCEKQLRVKLGPYYQLHNSVICAGGVPDKDACEGDGGSPLVCPIQGQPNRYVQMGIVSGGLGCGDPNDLGLYGNLPLFKDWIDTQVKSFGLDISSYQY